MRRFTSILLVVLLLFNTLGFYGFISMVKYHHNKVLIERFDMDNYDHQEAITLEIPHSIPYISEQPNFIRVDGEFQHEGEYYKMVKQRLSVDTIYMVAIKDHMSRKANEILSKYSKSLTAEQSAEKHDGKVSVNFLKDYFGSAFAMVVITYGQALSNVKNGASQKHYTSANLHSVFNPPEQV